VDGPLRPASGGFMVDVALMARFWKKLQELVTAYPAQSCARKPSAPLKP
jgi:hypothetical protein